jgi:4-hydroxybenzoate polyprenyltransferase
VGTTDAAIYIVVDLDGTLVNTDTLVESIFKLLLQNPTYAFHLPFWLLSGKSFFKSKIASLVTLDPASLPYHEDFLFFLRRERAKGKRLILATAAHESIGRSVADHLDLFESVVCTQTSGPNLTGQRKLEAIPAAARPFIYAGNEKVDGAIWKESAGAIVVGDSRIHEFAKNITPIVKWFEPKNTKFKIWRKGLRIHQWAKNFLIFLPLILAHRIFEAQVWIMASIGFFAFSLIASSVYLLNDLLDLEADRQHPEKKSRPLANGDISLFQGIYVAAALLLVGMILAAFTSKSLLIVLIGYYALTTIYSFKLKKVPVIDAFTLAGLYTWRILSGGVVTGTRLTVWLLGFSVFFFLSLAFAKRSTELKLMISLNRKKALGRGYYTDDINMVNMLGVASGMASVVVFTLYMNQPVVTQLYLSPRYLLAVAIVLLFWISRVWFLTERGQMNADPILFAVKDRISYLLLALITATLIASKFL